MGEWRVTINGVPLDARLVQNRVDLYGPPVVRHTKPPVRALEICHQCGDEHVMPVLWNEVGDGWSITRRCPNCELVSVGEFTQTEAERYNHVMNAGLDRLEEALERAELDSLTDWMSRFVVALERDAILPEDF